MARAILLLLVFYSAVNAQDGVVYEEIMVPDRIHDSSTADINARSEFSVGDQVARQYLAIVLEITKTTVTPIDSSLVRGPSSLSSAANKDLQVRALQSTRVVSQYSVQDPRFVKRERSVTGRVDAWVELVSANQVVYIPLSSLIDKVEVAPETGRAGTVSSGGDFDPRPWATVACDGHDPDLYPNCAAVIALGIPSP